MIRRKLMTTLNAHLTMPLMQDVTTSQQVLVPVWEMDVKVRDLSMSVKVRDLSMTVKDRKNT